LSNELQLSSDAAYTEAFLEVFREAVRARLRSAFPVGSTLSGGLDSSSVAGTAAGLLAESGRPRLHTFSAVFPNLARIAPLIDERPYIEAMLATGRFEPHIIRADQLSPLFPNLWQGVEALIGLNLYMDQAIFREAQEHGVRVMLDGHDGDTIVSDGYELLSWSARTGRWRLLLHESAALAERYGVSRRQIIWGLSVKPLVPSPVLKLARFARYGRPGWTIGDIVNPSFAQRIGLGARLGMLSADGSNSARRFQEREKHWQSLSNGLFTYTTELVDNLAAPCAVEPRHPFLDRRVVEFCLALPLEQRLRHGWPRAILRCAMADVLPSDVRWRPQKGDLSANFQLGLLWKERDNVEAIILHNPNAIAPYVNVPVLQQMYQRYAARPLRCTDEALAINFAIILARWLNHTGLVRPAL
jgi:asparagine synthase (glutamine-hydrolysing)